MRRRAPWKRWRSVTAGGSLLTFLAGLLGTWGQEPVRSLAVGGGLTLASVLLYLVRWWLHGTGGRQATERFCTLRAVSPEKSGKIHGGPPPRSAC